MANITSSPKLVFFGTGPVSLATLKGIKDHFSLEAIVTKPTHKGHQAIVADWAKAHNIPVHEPSTREDLEQLFTNKTFPVKVGLVVDYGLILPKAVLNHFPLGIVNSHFSLLPEWRGADPITFAILSGQQKTGVSLMLIEEKLDTGKLLIYKSLQIAKDETTPSLTNKLVELSNQLLIEYLPRYVAGDLKPKAQPHPNRATYSHKISKPDGLVNWGKPANILEREIRAYQGWPGSYTTLGGRDVTITKAGVRHQEAGTNNKPGQILPDKNELLIQTGDGVLVVERVKPAGKNEMGAADFMRGYLK